MGIPVIYIDLQKPHLSFSCRKNLLLLEKRYLGQNTPCFIPKNLKFYNLSSS